MVALCTVPEVDQCLIFTLRIIIITIAVSLQVLQVLQKFGVCMGLRGTLSAVDSCIQACDADLQVLQRVHEVSLIASGADI